MSLYIEEKYVKMLSHRLLGFAAKGNHLYNFRCPICEDSKKKNKKRGYFYAKKGSMLMCCHNCGASKLFRNFLKDFDPNLHKQYALEIFKDSMHKELINDEPEVIPETIKYIPDIFEDLPLIRNMDEKSQAHLYCKKRCLPIEDFDFRFAENFIEWTKGNTDKFESWKGEDHSRIIIPWRHRNQKIIGYSARTLGNEEPKYYCVFVDDSIKEKWFGFDRIDESKQVFVVEGEIDSLCIDNCIAVGNAKLQQYLNREAIYLPDSDIRNVQVMKNVSKMIDMGLKVCMLPTALGKDLNEMVQHWLSKEDIISIINKNTYQGLEAQLKFTTWGRN